MNGLTKLVLVTVIVMTLGSAVAVWLTPPTPQGARIRRQAEAQKLVDQLTHATWNYFHERGEFPPGDGRGTGGLVRALETPSASGVPFMIFSSDLITATGDLRDPLAPGESVLHYRNNRTAGEGGRNDRSFDLWSRGVDGSVDGVNNWDGWTVSGP